MSDIQREEIFGEINNAVKDEGRRSLRAGEQPVLT